MPPTESTTEKQSFITGLSIADKKLETNPTTLNLALRDRYLANITELETNEQRSLAFAMCTVSAEWEPAFLRQAREFLFFPLLPREASKSVPIFDRGTGSKPERLRSGFLQADLSLIVQNDPPARVTLRGQSALKVKFRFELNR